MILLTGLLLALFVFPDGWEVPVIIGFGILEIAETAITWRFSQIWAPLAGPETLIGARGRAITDCRPSGTVRVQAEEWQARCDAGVDAGAPVRVLAREGLVLTVEPTEEAAPNRAADPASVPPRDRAPPRSCGQTENRTADLPIARPSAAIVEGKDQVATCSD